MAKKPAQEGANKTDLTKQYVEKHPTAGLNEIVDALKQQGVDISRSLASKIKYGRASAKKGRKAKKTRARVASKNGDSGYGQKSEAIRSAAKSLGKKVRPRDVIAILKEQGIEVSAAQVSTTLKAMGMRHTRRGGGVGASAAAPRSAGRSESISIDDLVATKKLVEQLGGIEQAKAVVSALATLS